MLRIHFSDADLARTRLATAPDPMWEIAASLHRLQNRRGRSPYAAWYRDTRARLRDATLERRVREQLLPLYPLAAYFPDFLTPPSAGGSLEAGLEALLATPPERVRSEVALLANGTGTPGDRGAAGRSAWLRRLPDLDGRRDFADALRAYYRLAIEPHSDQIQGRIEAERALRGRAMLDGGAEGLLRSLAPAMLWEPPVLRVPVYPEDRDLHLAGRGLRLVPSYFCQGNPVAFADEQLEPILVYTVHPEAPPPPGGLRAPLATLLGRTRATVLHATAHGATTSELARIAGVSASAASQHATALRDAGLLHTQRLGTIALHTLTPTGTALLRGGTPPEPGR